jgi:predicted transcriptional regulator
MEHVRPKVIRLVARHLNFSRAAEELLLTQPAVTQQISSGGEECNSATQSCDRRNPLADSVRELLDLFFKSKFEDPI